MPECLSSLRAPVVTPKERGLMMATPTSARIEEFCQELVLTPEQIQDVYDKLMKQINLGLGKETNAQAAVKCFPTYVKELPNGHERGRFLALDLGGTNFRVLLIELNDGNFKMESKIFAVPQSIMQGAGHELFDHIAECLSTFAHMQHIEHEVLPLGFTFSFPCSQHGLTEARLTQWTKGFSCSGVEGEDVVKLLEEAIERRGDVKIKVCAVLNDTTGTLMSCAWKNHNTYIGLIIGTGTNACYVERLENVGLWDGDWEEPKQVLINTEWGAFGGGGDLDSVLTEYDRDIDQHSINPGRQLFEKMISGMYLGEVARQLVQKLTKQGLLFGGQGSDALFERGGFFTKYITEVESDAPGDYTNCRMVLEELGIEHATDEDCENLRYVCEVVSRRAAFLVGTGLAVLLNKMDRPSVTVGVDGSVYRYHPHVHRLMCEQISRLVRPGMKFDLMLSEDGSGRGAALVAAVASRTAAT
ncbi:hexokinase type 2-like isoform X3 [Amphibalanus amphitrite]|nr:hexokinase type 2-like isoform X3 [Amphibalanus amphitrite]